MKPRTLLLSGVVAALAFVPPTSASAQFQLGKDTSYFCVGEFAGGISYDEATKKWKGTAFRADEKFVLRLKFLKTRIEKWYGNENETVYYYNATITASGQNSVEACENDDNSDPKTHRIKEGFPFLFCWASLQQYKFNLKDNRFLRSYLVGYFSGGDNNKNTPSVAGGTCTKID